MSQVDRGITPTELEVLAAKGKNNGYSDVYSESPPTKKQRVSEDTTSGCGTKRRNGGNECPGFNSESTSNKKQGLMNECSDKLGLMPEGEKNLQLHKEHIPPSQKLFFGDYPLQIVSGQGQYFYDEHGQKYLDTVNNVACVGHSHPKVVEACYMQMATLCTNSRFLNERICTYAKKLCATFPAQLSCCFFTNSGSEANDLALQLAKVFTNREHIISLEGCYHGHLMSLRSLSQHKYARGFSDHSHVSVASVPDVYRGKYRDRDTAGSLYAMEVKEIAEEQKKKGDEVAVYIHEPMMSCAGQVIPPKGYLKEVYKYIHDAGGVVIADEVQTGFARVGDHFWAFELSGVCPDIVTIGKPMGNGHPVSAVVTTKEIADKFASSGVEYFNTFGGNPVSMAIAEAVLTVIEEEGLQQNAKQLGEYLLKELVAMQERHECIGDVRGAGLFIGVDIVKDKESREQDVELARIIKYRMLLEHKVIIHVDGVLPNVIKFKPPLVLTKEDCTHFLQALDSVLTSKEQQ